MEKFLQVPVYGLVVSGTSVTPVGSADLTDTGNVFAPVSVGDIVHQSTDNEYFLVASKIDDNNLTLTALDGGTAPIVSGKSFFIHSGSVANNQILGTDRILLVEQTSTTTTTLTYDEPNPTDVVVLTHTPVGAGSEAVRDTIQKAIISASQTPWKQVVWESLGAELLAAENIKVIAMVLS